jgi:hypothetical protein
LPSIRFIPIHRFDLIFICFSLSSSQTGCMGCASGKGAGPRNIFGNKYGQNLAAVQVAREKRMEAKEKQAEEERQRHEQEEERRQAAQPDGAGDEETDDDETDDEDEDDYGPSPAAGIWAGSQKLQQESEQIVDADGDEETDDEEGPPSKKVRAN